MRSAVVFHHLNQGGEGKKFLLCFGKGDRRKCPGHFGVPRKKKERERGGKRARALQEKGKRADSGKQSRRNSEIQNGLFPREWKGAVGGKGSNSQKKKKECFGEEEFLGFRQGERGTNGIFAEEGKN